MTLLKLISKCIMKISFEAMEVLFSVGLEKNCIKTPEITYIQEEIE